MWAGPRVQLLDATELTKVIWVESPVEVVEAGVATEDEVIRKGSPTPKGTDR